MEHGADLLHNPGHTARVVEILGRPLTGGTDIQQIVCAPMEPVKGLRIQRQAKFVGNRRNVQQRVGGAGNGSVYHHSVLKGLHRDDIPRLQPHFRQLHHLMACLLRYFPQIRASGWHQSGTGEHQAQGFRHDLHGGRSPDK